MLFSFGFAAVIIGYFYNLNKQLPRNIILSQEHNINNEKRDISSQASQIKEFKDLLDSGAITQEEYDKKKDEILHSNEY